LHCGGNNTIYGKDSAFSPSHHWNIERNEHVD